MIIYQISLPKKEDAEPFVTFMRDEYFPAIHKEATRAGQVTSLELLQQEFAQESENCEFFWHIGWNGIPNGVVSVDSPEASRKLESFNASIKRLGSFVETAVWQGNGSE